MTIKGTTIVKQLGLCLNLSQIPIRLFLVSWHWVPLNSDDTKAAWKSLSLDLYLQVSPSLAVSHASPGCKNFCGFFTWGRTKSKVKTTPSNMCLACFVLFMFCFVFLFLKGIFWGFILLYSKISQTFLLKMDVTNEHIHPRCLDCESLVPGNPMLLAPLWPFLWM